MKDDDDKVDQVGVRGINTQSDGLESGTTHENAGLSQENHTFQGIY